MKPFKFKPKITNKAASGKKPVFSHGVREAAKDVAIIGAGGFIGGAAEHAVHREKQPMANNAPMPNIKRLQKKQQVNFGWKHAAGAVGVIAGGDVLGDEALTAVERRARRKKMLVKRGIEQKTAVPGAGPTSLQESYWNLVAFEKKSKKKALMVGAGVGLAGLGPQKEERDFQEYRSRRRWYRHGLRRLPGWPGCIHA